jgi:hypothetical protein
MTKKFSKTLARIIAGFTLILLPMMPVAAHAGTISQNIENSVGCGTTGNFATSGTTACGSTQSANSSVNQLLTDAVNIFSVVVGVVAVIMIIVGGFKYITSGGDSSKVSSAQSTILYAIIGLVVVVLSQVIVHFVLSRVATINT